MKLKRIICFACFLTAGFVLAEPLPLDGAILQAQQDITEARGQLNRQLEIQAKERQALQAQIDALRESIRDLTTNTESLKDTIKAQQQEKHELATRHTHLLEITSQSHATLTEYRRRFEARLLTPEVSHFQDRLTALDLALASSDHPLKAAPQLLNLYMKHATLAANGWSLAGSALDTSGTMLTGTFLRLGPLLYFAGSDQTSSGLTNQTPQQTLPTVIPTSQARLRSNIVSLVDGQPATVPVDVTNGEALRLLETQETWIQHLAKGGITMIPLGLMAIVCLALTLTKFITMPRLTIPDTDKNLMLIIDLVNQNNISQAQEMAQSLPDPLAPVICDAIRHRQASKDHLEEIIIEAIMTQTPRLERYLAAIAVCGSSAPLLGLFGTVTGMIHTFKMITLFGSGNVQLLSTGIAEALITTQYGLVIAIPALLAHAWLNRQVKKTMGSLQQAGIMFINGTKLKGSQT